MLRGRYPNTACSMLTRNSGIQLLRCPTFWLTWEVVAFVYREVAG